MSPLYLYSSLQYTLSVYDGGHSYPNMNFHPSPPIAVHHDARSQDSSELSRDLSTQKSSTKPKSRASLLSTLASYSPWWAASYPACGVLLTKLQPFQDIDQNSTAYIHGLVLCCKSTSALELDCEEQFDIEL